MSVALLVLLYVVGAVVLLLVLAFLFITGYIAYVHWKYSHIPQPKRPSFYLGHLPDAIRAQKDAGNDELVPLGLVQYWLDQVDSPTVVLFVIYRPIVFTVDPENIKTIIMRPDLNKHRDFTDKIGYVMGQRFMGNGLVSIPDFKTWKPRRQLYDPSFRKNYLKTLLDPINEMVNRFLEQINPLANGEAAIPMKRHFGEFTLNIISKVAFGIEPTEAWSDESLGLKRVKSNGTISFLTDHVFRGLGKYMQFPWYQYLHPFEAEGYREAMRALRKIGRDCIKKRIEMVKNGEQVPSDILTQILQMATTSEGVNIEELVDDFVTFYVAGQETTSSLLSFALILTLQHPHVLERLESEVGDVLGDRDYVTIEDLEKLQYTEQILKETLRMHGPAFGTAKCSPPEGITLNGYYIPGGTELSLPTASLCRMPQYFDDPDTFNPSRFDPENKKPDTFVYFPFGLGHRACIGKHFAMMEAKIAFTRLFQQYEVSLPEDYELVPVQRFTIQVKGDIPCSIKRRK